MTLRIGSKGPDVTALQLWLVGQGLLIKADGDFGALTDGAVRAMQIRCAIKSDGIVGDAARLAFARAGWVTAPDGKLPPCLLKALTAAERDDIFGRIECIPASNRSDVVITNGWAKGRLVDLTIPQLIGIPGAPKGGKVLWHKLAAKALTGFFAEVEAQGLLHLVKSWGGGWCPRYIRGSTTVLSAHAWATAFDINVAWNGLGVTPAAEDQPGTVIPLVPIATKHRLFWGGHFKTRPDGMHLEATGADP